MDINEKRVERVDADVIDFNGKRYSLKEFKAYLLELATEASIELIDENEKEHIWNSGYEEGQRSGYECALNEHYCEETEPNTDYKCYACDRVLNQELVERLSDRVSPSIESKDIVNTIFGLYDYNEACKK